MSCKTGLKRPTEAIIGGLVAIQGMFIVGYFNHPFGIPVAILGALWAVANL